MHEMTLRLNAMVHGHLLLPSSLLIPALNLQIEHALSLTGCTEILRVIIAFQYVIFHVTWFEEVLFQTENI